MKKKQILLKLFLFISIYTSYITLGHTEEITLPGGYTLTPLCAPENNLDCIPSELRLLWVWNNYAFLISGSDTIKIIEFEINDTGEVITKNLGNFSTTITAAFRTKLEQPTLITRISTMTLQVNIDGLNHEITATLTHVVDRDGNVKLAVSYTTFDGIPFGPYDPI